MPGTVVSRRSREIFRKSKISHEVRDDSRELPELGEPIEPERVYITHFFSLFFRHSDQRIFDKAPRPGISRRNVRIVRFPHDVIDADQLAQLDTRLFVPKIDVYL